MTRRETERSLLKVLHGIGAVCFDAFGTLVEIRDKRRAYAPLLRAVAKSSRVTLKNRLMRECVELEDWSREIGDAIPSKVLDRVRADISAEIVSMALRPGMAHLWGRLRGAGLKIGLCSNLAAPYGPPLRGLVPDGADAEVLSYEVGHIKPEPEIYQLVVERLAVPASRILFVGDTPKADIEGPRASGMQAMDIRELEAVMGVGESWRSSMR